MNDEDFDIQRFAKLFDAALASDNPAVKKALRNFMMVAAIVEAEDTDRKPGTMQQVLNQVNDVEKRLSKIEQEVKNNDYATQMVKELSKKHSWNQYTTTGTSWPSTYTTGYKSSNIARSDIDYLSKLLDGKGTP